MSGMGNRTPGRLFLVRCLEKGMTQAQIVDAWEQATNYRVSRSAVAMAIAREGLKSAHERPEYKELLPWVIAPEHRHHIDARMLRLEGRRRNGGTLSEGEARWLENWLEDLARPRPGAPRGAVVHYDRQTDEGFFWIPRTPDHDDIIEPVEEFPRPRQEWDSEEETPVEQRF